MERWLLLLTHLLGRWRLGTSTSFFTWTLLVQLEYAWWLGSWYVIMVVDNYSHCSWVFLMVTKDEAFVLFEILTRSWEVSFQSVQWEPFAVIMGHNLRMLILTHFLLMLVTSTSFLLSMCLNKMVLSKGRMIPLLRLLGWCSMSKILLGRDVNEDPTPISRGELPY